MAEHFSENDALSALGIKSFSDVNNRNFIKFASVFDKLSPECQLKAIEAIPAFIDIAKEAVSSYNDILEKACTNNANSVDQYYAACNKMIEGLNNLLSSDSLSFEDKKIVIEYLMIIERNMSAKDSENKEFLKNESEKTRNGIKAIITGLVVIGLSALGATIGFSSMSNRRSV